MTNDNFKTIPQSKWFELHESQVCVVILESGEVFAGYSDGAEEEPFDLQGCYEYTYDKKWSRASGSEQGMSYCGLEEDMIQNVFVPKADVELDACMALWS